MLEPDGNMLVKSAAGYSMVPASRWEELRQALKFHIDLVMKSGTQAEFRFLNASNPVLVSPEHPEVRCVIIACIQLAFCIDYEKCLRSLVNLFKL